MTSYRNLLLCLTLLLPVRIAAQSYTSQQLELAERLSSLSGNAPPELAYIQTSKDIYETGEDLWFKVYLLDAQYLTPSPLSKTLYLQLVNETSKREVWQEKYEIQNGLANGQVYLDNDLPEGEYLLEVFTPNSFFSDTSEFHAVRRILIKKDISSTKKEEAKTGKSPENKKENKIQFTTFPEGGNLVTGIQCNLAFKAVKSDGVPIDVKGILFQDSVPIKEFSSKYAGMGSFNFTPEITKKYFIRITVPKTDSTFLIPEINKSGIVMQLTGRVEDSLTLMLMTNNDAKAENIYLRIQGNGVLYGLTTKVLNKKLNIKVPVLGLPQGITEITLFDSRLMPVAERLVFINRDRKLNISTELSKEIFQTRGKAKLKIKVTDQNGDPAVANLGVTVFDKAYQDPSDSSNILTHYYLSTQLKGRIYNPSYYFHKGKDREDALDLLMLTQGWRRYVWNEANLEHYSHSGQIIYDGIKGEIFYPNQKKKFTKDQKIVIAFSPNKDSTKVLIPADSMGRFTIPEDRLKEWENDYVYMKPFGLYGGQPIYKITDPQVPVYNLQIKITDPFATIKDRMSVKEICYPYPAVVNVPQELPDLKTGNNTIEIPSVTIHGRKINAYRGKFMGTLDSIAKYDLYFDYVCQFQVLNCPRHKRDDTETFASKPVPGKWYYEIIAYNTPAEHAIYVMYQPPHFKEDEILKMSNMSRVKAYHGNREFYKPNYDKVSETDIVPDYRNTLLWEPSVITDENGEATLSFYCSDINTDFVGRIEGVGEQGLLGAENFKITVRKLNITPSRKD